LSILFLDIDGVLNSTRSCLAQPKSIKKTPELKFLKKLLPDSFLEYGIEDSIKCVDPVSVALLNKLLRETQANLVLSSSHRKYLLAGTYFKSAVHLTRVRAYLSVLGVDVPEFLDLTDNLPGRRGNEIEKYLSAVVYEQEHAILDDSADFLPGQNLVRCDSDVGMDFRAYTVSRHLLSLQEHSSCLK
jgi:hypothetical protein